MYLSSKTFGLLPTDRRLRSISLRSKNSLTRSQFSKILFAAQHGYAKVCSTQKTLALDTDWSSREAESKARNNMDRIGPTSHSFISQRLRLHYVDWGNPEAPPLLLIHGGRDHCRNWDWAAERLRKDWHVIAPDLRGHGDSAWSPDGNYPTLPFLYDLSQLIHQLDLAPVTIVAHSMGGNIAIRYTGIFPENVRKLVAIEGLGPSPDMIKET